MWSVLLLVSAAAALTAPLSRGAVHTCRAAPRRACAPVAQLTEAEIADLQTIIDFQPSLEVLKNVKAMIDAERLMVEECAPPPPARPPPARPRPARPGAPRAAAPPSTHPPPTASFPRRCELDEECAVEEVGRMRENIRALSAQAAQGGLVMANRLQAAKREAALTAFVEVRREDRETHGRLLSLLEDQRRALVAMLWDDRVREPSTEGFEA